MRKENYKKILAMILAASMLFQSTPSAVFASEKTETTASQEETGDIDQETEPKAEQKQEAQKNDDAQSNAASDAEEQPQTEEQEPKAQTTETDQEDGEADPEAQSLVVNGIVSINSSADFINLSNEDAANYQKAVITITRGAGVAFDLTKATEDGKTFQGFGSKENPFQGTIKITNSESGIEIPVNRSFFNYLDQSAKIEKGLYLKAGESFASPLLAENYVNDSKMEAEAELSLIIDAATDTNSDTGERYSFGSLIGSMAANTKLSLSVDNKITDAGKTRISGTGNLGFFCNTMEEGASLTIAAYTGDSGYVLSTENGHAGGLVGEMKSEAKLTVTPALTLEGSVQTTGKGYVAGGLVGKADTPEITLTGKLTGKETVAASGDDTSVGGFIGNADFKKTKTLDFSNLDIQTTVEDGSHTGGLFGVLNFDCMTVGTLTLLNVTAKPVFQGSSWQSGGVIGQYTANSLKSTLSIPSSTVTITHNGSAGSFGGVIGFVAGTGAGSALGNATAAYVEINGASVSVDAESYTIPTDGGRFGGLVAEMSGAGHFLSVSGHVSIESSNVGSKVPGMGGILGKATNGVLRVSGTTDLSKLTFSNTGTSFGQIAGEIDGTIVYALGSGNDDDDTENSGWKFIRPASCSVSALGSYGEVIRLNGTDLKEATKEGETVASDFSDEKDLIHYYPSLHQIIVCYNALNAASGLTVNNRRDLVALSMILQCGITSDMGAYCNSYGAKESLLGKNITINASQKDQTIDLSGTGCTGLLRDNGVQKYTGTFDGNNCTIQLATGEAYGYTSEGAAAENPDGKSTNRGIGQIYNHSTIGFLPYCNGTVQNLTLSGHIYFQNVDGGLDVQCGAVAGSTDGVTVSKVTVDTKIIYSDGAGGGSLKTIYTGGFVGRTTKGNAKIFFEKCAMKGTIENTSNCHDFAMGGYLAEINADNTNVSFQNCELNGAKITFNRTEKGDSNDAQLGGLIGRIGTNKQTHTVTIDGLEITDSTVNGMKAETSCGGLFGYQWLNTNVTLKNVTVSGSKVSSSGIFGGLVYRATGYWKIGSEGSTGSTSDADSTGITFKKTDTTANQFNGKTSADTPSALLVASTASDNDKVTTRAYLEILKGGLDIQEDAVTVTLTGGDYFDDIAGKTKYDGNTSSVVSIGLTNQTEAKAVLIDKEKCNTWHNQCKVNGKTDYKNGQTRYYYNVDYYRKEAGDTVTEINTPGKLLLWSLNRYTALTSNLTSCFKTGGSITGTIDLSGVSYYPVVGYANIHDATITFDYTDMNGKEGETPENKKYDASDLQHYQMHTGLFSKVTTPSSGSIALTVTKLTLKGTVGAYEYEKDAKGQSVKAGALICDYVEGNDSNHKVTLNLSGIKLDGIYVAPDAKSPLLINSVTTYCAVNMSDVTTGTYDETIKTRKAASALMGAVGSNTAKEITLDFSDMDLNGTKADSIFNQASFATSFQYSDEVSGGTYNFETTTQKVTYGVEISNGHNTESNFKYNRNSYNATEGTGQVWYLDTFGETEGNCYVSANGASNTITDFTTTDYLPYIGHYEDAENKYYELDVNQRTVYIVDGCGTYGHPYQIKTVKSTTDGKAAEDAKDSFTGADQLIAIMNLLDGKGSGTAVCIDPATLTAKHKGAQEMPTIHTKDKASGDKIYIKVGSTWYPAVQNANGRYTRDTSSAESCTNDQIISYLRNAYYQIEEDITLNLNQFTGIGGSGTFNAFSGVIIGNKDNTPTITLTGTSKNSAVGGLIRYSQGSVVKDINIKIQDATIYKNKTSADNDLFFGGAIGYVIGGDNIIDNVSVSTAEGGLTIDGGKQVPVGGCVGLVGGDNCLKGGGVIFRNMPTVSTGTDGNTVGKLAVVSDGKTSVDVTTEVSAGNTHYYWNPYVGRVLDGYACAECEINNTDKNYTIPKLGKDEKLSITGSSSGSVSGFTVYDKSQITIDSAQDFWVLSALVNSGFGAKATNGYYVQPVVNLTGSQNVVSEAYYYGHVRSGSYDKIGTADCDAAEDEGDFWGGRLYFDDTVTDHLTDHRAPSQSYLAVNYVQSENTNAKNYELASYIAYDKEYRTLQIKKPANTNEKSYDFDLTVYGNGFRGIGQGYMYNGITSTDAPTKLRSLRLGDRNSQVALEGNKASVSYMRSINEYNDDKYFVRQAGLFPQLYGLSSTKNYTVQNLTVTGTVQSNVERTSTALKYGTYFGVIFANAGYYIAQQVTFKNVNVGENSLLSGGEYAGGIYACDQWTHTGLNFYNCSVTGLRIEKARWAGGFSGLLEDSKVATTVATEGGGKNTINNTIIQTRDTSTGSNKVRYAGGLFGQVKSASLTVSGVEVTDSSILPYSCGEENGADQSYSGGIVGKIERSMNVNDVSISSFISLCNGYIGGIAGGNSSGGVNVSNVSVSDSKLVTKRTAGGAGALSGYINTYLNGFNVQSKNNLVGFLIENKNCDTDASIVKENDEIKLEKLSSENVGVRYDSLSNTASKYYYTYNKINDMPKIVDTRIGIWVGTRENASSNIVKIVAASRIGEYSPICNVGWNGMTSDSYVIYADYQGKADLAEMVNVSPDNQLTMGETKLTSDGAALKDNKALSKTIVSESMSESKMTGYHGGTATNDLEDIIKLFAAGTAYDSRLTTYKTEEKDADYSKVTGAVDIPILVLQMDSPEEIMTMVNNYVSVLTNMKQDETTRYASVSVTPTTYAYENGSWRKAKSQSMSLTASKQLKINSGQYDNTRNQITILDVAYTSPVDTNQAYHLYIPVLVKKVIEVSFAVKMANGAAGYEAAYQGTQAVLASFGENLTADLSFTYTWTVGEWKNALANGDSLLWSYSKKLNLANTAPLKTGDTHLTLVDRNTHGSQKSYYPFDGTVIQEESGRKTLDLKTVMTKTESDGNEYQGTYLCDLLDLTVSAETKEDPGEFKKLESEKGATVRVWNAESKKYEYYAPRADKDPEGTNYFNIELNTKESDDKDLTVTEQYYLVMNCTKGSGMYNETLNLNGITDGEIPTRYVASKTPNAVYVLGDFYKNENLNLVSTSEIAQKNPNTANALLMKSGENDSISVKVTSEVQAAADEKTFSQYVNSRAVYYRYEVQLVDENSQPVDIQGTIAVPSLKIGAQEVTRVDDLSTCEEGFTVVTSGSVCYITIKALGSKYIGSTLEADLTFDYSDSASLLSQFPLREKTEGVQFKVSSSMAYQTDSLDSSNMSQKKEAENKLYYREEVTSSSISYDSYNITSPDGNTSQLGLNGRETDGKEMQIRTRAFFTAGLPGANQTDPENTKYPYYLEGTLRLSKKTEELNANGIGKTYESVQIGSYLSDFAIESDNKADTTGNGLGLQTDNDGNQVYKFRISLSEKQVKELQTNPILVNIDFNAKTGSDLEAVDGSQYANYKVDLSAELKNKKLNSLTNLPSDYLIYTNAKIYLKIIGNQESGQ